MALKYLSGLLRECSLNKNSQEFLPFFRAFSVAVWTVKIILLFPIEKADLAGGGVENIWKIALKTIRRHSLLRIKAKNACRRFLKNFEKDS